MRTAEELVTQALIEIGALESGETPEAEEMADAIVRLNAMLKSWDGVMSRDSVETVNGTGGNGAVAANAGTRDISSIRYGTSKRYMTEWNRQEWLSLPNRTQAGDAIAWYVSKDADGLTINVWPVPAANYVLECDCQMLPATISAPSDTPDLPDEWEETIIMGLASRLTNMFGTTRIDVATVQRVDSKAAILYQKMLDRDRPSSYYFEPDC